MSISSPLLHAYRYKCTWSLQMIYMFLPLFYCGSTSKIVIKYGICHQLIFSSNKQAVFMAVIIKLNLLSINLQSPPFCFYTFYHANTASGHLSLCSHSNITVFYIILLTSVCSNVWLFFKDITWLPIICERATCECLQVAWAVSD